MGRRDPQDVWRRQSHHPRRGHAVCPRERAANRPAARPRSSCHLYRDAPSPNTYPLTSIPATCRAVRTPVTDYPGTYTFTFSRFPGPDAFVMLATPSEPPEESIQKLATQVRLRVVDQDGRVHCDGSGSPQGSGDQRLVVTSSKGVLGLWHTRLRASRAECLQSVSTSRVGRRRGSRHSGATARSDGAGWGRRAAQSLYGNRSRPAHSATRGSRSYATRQHDAYETPN